jgi:hypothetical protein
MGSKEDFNLYTYEILCHIRERHITTKDILKYV